ncbi:MAG: hypothetical protein UT64_C0061G0001, partial [Candidatus Falkowbacteria bacterium GW2011_GWF2_39_8]
ERYIDIVEVTGSNPVSSTSFLAYDSRLKKLLMYVAKRT